ncbi:hypothetical protein JIN77_04060 [Verrucomicrobiaceae bacterium R5-34]|uniref:CorA-like Mg2+ transporter protein n=1 Tax=Oceaniferula flava TaxID=2800421 RepID=A0AAE2SHB0_9BACT|nr:hypothetical protein [Oceaniferula flavus]MBK1829886.1 hypothetical protein [Verrucomicrobiaceae bacterium R5-34]MBK1856356.1 hypothetical protein [Oceaniferula flavus]MBM1137663.1 hypothetical protein [Oceaniferula flavus]
MKPTPREKSIIPQSWDVPEAMLHGIGKKAGRQKMIREDDHILLILHQLPELGDDGRRKRSLFWRNPAGQWKSKRHGDGIESLQKHVQIFAKAVEKVDAKLDVSNDAGDYLEVLRVATPLHRSCRNKLAVLEELRDVLPEDAEVMSLRDWALGLERSTEFICADARHGMDFCMAESAERQARASRDAGDEARLLNRLVAFFFPVATLAAIGGMNPPGEVFGSQQIWMILAIGLVAGLVLHYSNVLTTFLNRKKRREREED